MKPQPAHLVLTFSLVTLLSSAQRPQDTALKEEEQKFLLEAIDARLMDLEEGKLAVARGTHSSVKTYGERMVKDQTAMLTKAMDLAAAKKMPAPGALSEEKAKGLEKLRSEREGEDFDNRFIKMMIIDHKRDVKEFKRAMNFGDNQIRTFASDHHSLIESHLEEVKEIKTELRNAATANNQL